MDELTWRKSASKCSTCLFSHGLEYIPQKKGINIREAAKSDEVATIKQKSKVFIRTTAVLFAVLFLCIGTLLSGLTSSFISLRLLLLILIATVGLIVTLLVGIKKYYSED